MRTTNQQRQLSIPMMVDVIVIQNRQEVVRKHQQSASPRKKVSATLSDRKESQRQILPLALLFLSSPTDKELLPELQDHRIKIGKRTSLNDNDIDNPSPVKGIEREIHRMFLITTVGKLQNQNHHVEEF